MKTKTVTLVRKSTINDTPCSLCEFKNPDGDWCGLRSVPASNRKSPFHCGERGYWKRVTK